MQGRDVVRDIGRAIADVEEALDVLRAESAIHIAAEGETVTDHYFSKVRSVADECYALRNFVRDQLG